MPGQNTPLMARGFVQLLDAQGERQHNSEYDPWVADVDDAALRGLLEDMVVSRRLDTEATALQRQGELALWPPLFGQEAIQIGSARALRSDDFVFSSYREHAVAYVRGVSMVDLLREWRGVAASGWDPYELNMATQQVIIGAQALHAVGYAMGIRNDGADSVAVAYVGDGALSQGDLNEALVFAASFDAPVLIICQNNQWAISEPVGLQSPVPLVDRARGFGIPGIQVDGNDVLASLAATRAALSEARDGGPVFIEALTYRMGPHTTADDPTRYRDAAEVDVWAERDPIARLDRYLRSREALDDDAAAQLEASADEAATTLREACTTMTDPEPLTVFDNAYAEPHATLDAQRETYAAYLDSFVE